MSRFLRIGILKSFKKVLIWPKNFLFTKFKYGYHNNAEFCADFETVEKNAKTLLTKKLQAKTGCKIGDFPCSLLLISKSFWQITFSGCTFFQFFPQIWNQREILRILDSHTQKRILKNFGVIDVPLVSLCSTCQREKV